MNKQIFILLAALGLPAAAPAASLQLGRDASALEFTAVGKPGFLRINGKGAHVTGTAARSAQGLEGVFEAVLDEFSTGIDLRDEHMKKKYLETAKYPTARLLWSVSGPLAAGEVPFKGTLTLHGVERPVEGKATLSPDAASGTVLVQATFPLKLSDFRIDVPKYLGVTVAEDVEVRAKISATGDVGSLGH